jgi:hypothetical protein
MFISPKPVLLMEKKEQKPRNCYQLGSWVDAIEYFIFQFLSELTGISILFRKSTS